MPSEKQEEEEGGKFLVVFSNKLVRLFFSGGQLM